MLVSPKPKVLPSQVCSAGRSVTVCAAAYSCVTAKAMFIVPRVTMKGGSLILVTSRPLSRPKPMVTAMPQAMASRGGRPWSTANLLMTMEPSAMTMPHDRSMPAVRMISVWPIAMTPTTMTCCRISEKLPADRKRSDWNEKNTQAASRASSGPSVAIGGRWCFQAVMLRALRAGAPRPPRS
jgi:hypothetical protein